MESMTSRAADPSSPPTDPSQAPEQSRRPAVLIFDVNETLSDMSPMDRRFEDVGAPAHLATTWFAGLLRDGFALSAVGDSQPFARLAAESLRVILHGMTLDREVEKAVDHILGGFDALPVHADVAGGIPALKGLGIRLVTLSNGAASVADALFSRAGIRGCFDSLLSVEQAGIWKPGASAYAYALRQCGVDPTEAMLVAVHPWDIEGAARAGLTTAWITRDGGAYPGYFSAPDLSARSLTELAEQLT